MRLSPPDPPRARPRSHRRDRGSAYLIALLVLVVLTMVGLSLALVTQTEQQVGAAEKEALRAFYAAESGVAVSTSSVLVTHDPLAKRIMLNRTTLHGTATEAADRVRMSPFFQISVQPCNLCQVNQGKEIYQVNHAVTAWSSRQTRPAGSSGAWSSELSAAAVGALIGVQPWDPNIAALQQTVNDPTTTQLIRY